MPTRPRHLSGQNQLPLMLGMVAAGLLLLPLVIFSGLGQQQAPAFLIWHMLLETLSIGISGLIFAFGWSTFNLLRQRNMLLVACTFLGVALLDFSHMLSFVGMPRYITANSVEKGIQFWLAARYLAAVALLLLVWLPWQQPQDRPPHPAERYLMLGGVLLLCTGVHLLIFVWPHLIPRTFIPGIGLTDLKIAAESGLILLHLLTILRLLPFLARSTRYNGILLLGTLLLSIMSGLMFTLYASATDIYNLTGHILKLQAYLLLYRAVFVETVVTPYHDLDKAARRNQALLKAIPDMMFELDASGRYLTVHGHSPLLQAELERRLLGRTMQECLPPETEALLRSAMQQTSADSNASVQVRAATRAGERDFEVVISQVPLDADGPRYMLLARDITERLQDQAQLRKLRAAVEQSPTPILITDLSGHIEYVNQAFSHFSGYSADEVVGRDPRLLKSGHTPPEVYQQMWRQLLRGEAWRGEFINRRKDGSDYHEQALISPITDEQGRITHYLSIKEDITQRKLDQQRITRLAHFDSLTGLPNRTLFRMQFDQALSLARRQGRDLALLFIDLDHFKNINDSLGHRVGDQLLHAVSERLLPVLRQGDSLSRQGGDEFMLLLPCSEASGAVHVAERLLELLQQPFALEDHQLMITASVGIALYPGDGENFDRLAQHADAAMYRAKQAGRNRYCFFTAEMQAQSARLLQLENALRQDHDHQQLQLHYQPQLDTRNERPCGVEVLLRWQHPQLGSISPAEFIPVAESSGLILDIGYWVLEQACQQMQRWRQQGLLPDCTISVNLSLLQLRDPRLVERVASVLQHSGLPAHCLELELTESAAMHNPQAAIASVQALHQLGVQLAIDDFGTGYSSLAHLRQFKVHTLKIDQSFVHSLCADGDDQSIIAAIISMAARLGISVIAEGVESPDQRALLRQLGCPQQQGYLFSRPLPAAGLELWLRQGSQPTDITHCGEHI